VARAPKICSHLGCSAVQPCPTHEVKAWASSTRRERTLSGSAQQRRAARIMRTYEHRCHVCGLPMADQVDHVQPLSQGGADDDSNLRPIHSRPCHADKTAREAAEGRAIMQQ
jgi:5-methylcytosine-specific restriction protein A